MKDGILPFRRQGGWTASHHLNYMAARYFRDAFAVSLDRLVRKERSLYGTGEHFEDEDLYVVSETGQERIECLRDADACLLFSCIAIEGFLNYYGVRRMDEPFFKKNMERMGITEKLALVIAACCQKRLDEDDEILKEIRWLFDERNSLIHPKSKDIAHHAIEEFISEHPCKFLVEKYVATLEAFVRFMHEIDPSISEWNLEAP